MLPVEYEIVLLQFVGGVAGDAIVECAMYISGCRIRD